MNLITTFSHWHISITHCLKYIWLPLSHCLFLLLSLYLFLSFSIFFSLSLSLSLTLFLFLLLFLYLFLSIYIFDSFSFFLFLYLYIWLSLSPSLSVSPFFPSNYFIISSFVSETWFYKATSEWKITQRVLTAFWLVNNFGAANQNA